MRMLEIHVCILCQTKKRVPYGRQNSSIVTLNLESGVQQERMRKCQILTPPENTCMYHKEKLAGIILHIYRIYLIHRTDSSGWKGSVSHGLGADISLPPCLATGIWNLGPKATPGPKSWGPSLGTTLWRHVQRYCARFRVFMVIYGNPVTLSAHARLCENWTCTTFVAKYTRSVSNECFYNFYACQFLELWRKLSAQKRAACLKTLLSFWDLAICCLYSNFKIPIFLCFGGLLQTAFAYISLNKELLLFIFIQKLITCYLEQKLLQNENFSLVGRVGLVVRALAFHQCGRPGFDFRTRCHMWIEFVGSLLCYERFSPGFSGFPLSSKNQHLIWFVNNDLGNVDLISSRIVKRIWSYSYANLRYRNIKYYYYYYYYYYWNVMKKIVDFVTTWKFCVPWLFLCSSSADRLSVLFYLN